jgi:hypothetical protein
VHFHLRDVQRKLLKHRGRFVYHRSKYFSIRPGYSDLINQEAKMLEIESNHEILKEHMNIHPFKGMIAVKNINEANSISAIDLFDCGLTTCISG